MAKKEVVKTWRVSGVYYEVYPVTGVKKLASYKRRKHARKFAKR